MFKIIKYLFLGLFAMIFIFAYQKQTTEIRSPSTSVVQSKPEKTKFSHADNFGYKVMSAVSNLKKNMKDPESFQLVEVLFNKDVAACLKFRGKNSFGAIILSSAVIVNLKDSTQYGIVTDEQSKKDYIVNFNKYCAEKQLIDETIYFKSIAKQI